MKHSIQEIANHYTQTINITHSEVHDYLLECIIESLKTAIAVMSKVDQKFLNGEYLSGILCTHYDAFQETINNLDDDLKYKIKELIENENIEEMKEVCDELRWEYVIFENMMIIFNEK